MRHDEIWALAAERGVLVAQTVRSIVTGALEHDVALYALAQYRARERLARGDAAGGARDAHEAATNDLRRAVVALDDHLKGA